MTGRAVLPVILLGLLLSWAPSSQHWRTLLVYNASDSMLRGWYLLEAPRAWRPGDIVLARLPARAGALAAQRGYLPTGVPVLKRVAAVAGQAVCVKDGLLRIDGAEAAHVLAQDGARRPLQGWDSCRTLADGELFLLGAGHPASFDSRYFGPVEVRDVMGAASPLWTWSGGRP